MLCEFLIKVLFRFLISWSMSSCRYSVSSTWSSSVWYDHDSTFLCQLDLFHSGIAICYFAFWLWCCPARWRAIWCCSMSYHHDGAPAEFRRFSLSLMAFSLWKSCSESPAASHDPDLPSSSFTSSSSCHCLISLICCSNSSMRAYAILSPSPSTLRYSVASSSCDTFWLLY